MKLSEVDTGIVKALYHKNISTTMGGDPEFFVADKKGKIMNADAFFPGKEDPIVIKKVHGDYFSKLFFDGIQAEMAVSFSICREFLSDNIRWCWQEAFKHMPDDHKVVLKPATKIQKSVIKQADPEARRFGCAPDFNAYTQSVNTPEMDASRHPFRYAGGHLHFGVPDVDLYRNDPLITKMATTEGGHLELIKFFDLLVTIPTLLLDNGPGSTKRRSKYGKAGCFRPTPYGIEYRTPSCWWLSSPMAASLIYGLGRMAWTIMGSGLSKEFRKAVKADEKTIQGAIDESDTKAVKQIWKNMRPYLALIGVPVSNPLHMGSVVTDTNEYVRDNYNALDGPPKLGGKKVYSLAVLEYMMKHGLDSVISDNVAHEWGLKEGSVYRDGLLNGGYHKLIGNDDFQKFQSSFISNFFEE